MAAAEQKDELIQILESVLSRRIRLNPEVLHYIDSTLAPGSARELCALLSDSGNCEAEAAVELLFFPDRALQESIEPVLAEAEFTTEEAREVTEALCRKNMEATVAFPDHRGESRLRVPATAAAQLVARLNITRRIDPQLQDAISEAAADPSVVSRLRVRLRNAAIQQSETQIAFLSALLRNAAADAEASRPLLELLDLSLYLMEQSRPDADLYAVLMDQKKLLIRSLYAAEKSRAQLAEKPVEALLMQGTPISSINPEEAGQQIAGIDRVSLLVFGKTEHYPPPEAVRRPVGLELPDTAEAGGIQAILRLLSG
jgi:hypothetical protein